MLDTKALAEATALIVREHVEMATTPLIKRIEELERRGPAPGEPGKDGSSVTLDDVAPMIEEAVAKAAAGIPVPAAGVGVSGAMIDRSGELVLTLSDGSLAKLGPVVGKDGDAGPAGRDGLDLKDIDVTLAPDGRTLVLSLDNGEVAYKAEVGIPTMIYRGVFVEQQAYEKGDTVTWAGSLWHCNASTKDKPGEGSEAWTLAVKKGRDAKPVSVA